MSEGSFNRDVHFDLSSGSFLDMRRNRDGLIKFWREEDSLILDRMKRLFDKTLNLNDVELFVRGENIKLLILLKKKPSELNVFERDALNVFLGGLSDRFNKVILNSKDDISNIIRNREQLYTFMTQSFNYIDYLEQKIGFLENTISSLKDDIIDYRLSLARNGVNSESENNIVEEEIIKEKEEEKVDKLPIKTNVPDYLG